MYVYISGFIQTFFFAAEATDRGLSIKTMKKKHKV